MKKKRTGNGTINSQNLYTMMNFPWVWNWKFGITGKRVGQRAKEINSEMPWYCGWFLPMSWVKVTFAYNIEQGFLDLTWWAQCTVWGHGGTEVRFIFPSVIVWAIVLAAAIVRNYGAFLLRWVLPPAALLYLLENF
jgi:hypothetical protein